MGYLAAKLSVNQFSLKDKMMTKEQIFKKSYAKELLRIGLADLDSLMILHAASSGRPENICFLAQQVVEKGIKSVLCHLELPIPFTHDIEFLIYRIPKINLPSEIENLSMLTEYATFRTYEEAVEVLNPDALLAAVQTAHAIVNWAKNIVFLQDELQENH